MSSVADILSELIAYPTPNPGGDELALCEYLAGALRDYGADAVTTAEVQRPGTPGGYVYARYGTPKTVINIHLDTVPVNDGWTRDPFAAVVEDDRVYGLGAADTKGAIAALLLALRKNRPKNLGILFSGDEERSTLCIHAFMKSSLRQGLERAIVCEPTGRKMGIAHRGISAYTARVDGRGGHSSAADILPKPIVVLAKLATALDAMAAQHRDSGGLCMNIAKLDGGIAFNVVPETASLTWSIRPTPRANMTEIEKQMHSIVTGLEIPPVVTSLIDHASFQCRDPAALSAMVGPTAGPATDLQFWTEAAVFGQAGIDAIVIGPGDIEQAHAANEFVTLSDLNWATALFTHVLTNT